MINWRSIQELRRESPKETAIGSERDSEGYKTSFERDGYRMDVTQIGLGLALLGVSSLTLTGPALLDSSALGYTVPIVAALVAAGALMIGVVRNNADPRGQY